MRFGNACIRRMRIPVFVVVDLVASGRTTAEILEDFPYLEAEEVTRALRFAALLTREEMQAGV